VLGSVVIIGGNILLIPLLGYLGCAIASVLAYLAMVIYCYFTGQKYFYIPYPVLKIIRNIVVAGLLITAYYYLKPANDILNYVLGLIITFIFTAFVYFFERSRIFSDKL
jgi:peptidoglycan biosynthesis protein MviN/MurJ (putative lipid II flippase)